ncbi:helix-turn-helix transcriptional regulator [Leifsonia sp. NCR5]|uniref:ArsR/SmtB family transcription factor n=1 Tax=Leifsonia sp. NCR5 TaxID=1978342 RepID=UPI000A1947F4|nr:helix-turn-helix transcriptional regulator [Leifsonia sp. NCR5]
MGEYQAATLDRVFGAISDPTRRAILNRLAAGDERVTEVASNFPISLNSVSKHVRVLEQAGLVTRTIQGRNHVLSLNADPMAEAAEWIDHYRAFWTDRLAALDRFVTGAGGATGATGATPADATDVTATPTPEEHS